MSYTRIMGDGGSYKCIVESIAQKYNFLSLTPRILLSEIDRAHVLDKEDADHLVVVGVSYVDIKLPSTLGDTIKE